MCQVHISRFLLQRFWRENARCFEKLTIRINFSQTSKFREAKASEPEGPFQAAKAGFFAAALFPLAFFVAAGFLAGLRPSPSDLAKAERCAAWLGATSG